MSEQPGLEAHLIVNRGSEFTLDITLTIPSGCTVALLGPNGAGKSTAVHALAGLLPLDGGEISLAGRTLDDPRLDLFVAPQERRIGVVFQDYVLFPNLTVTQNVAFGVRHRRPPQPSTRQTVMGWLERLDLNGLAERKPGDLSGGQAQRVALARALAAEPDLLLLDEPLSALDASTRVHLRRILADHLAHFRGPRLLITHDPTEAFLLADQIYVIEDGAITQVGTADDIRLRPRTSYIADLAGANLLSGTAAGGIVTTGTHQLQVADTGIGGSVLATIDPRAIALHRNPPEGSPRNAWQTTITRVEHYGDRVRLQIGVPLPLTAEITPGAVDALRLEEGSVVWISIKATEINVEPQ